MDPIFSPGRADPIHPDGSILYRFDILEQDVLEGHVTPRNRARSAGMKDIGTLRREVKKAYKRLRNWRKVAAEFGLSSGMAFRIARRKYEPKDAKIRQRLGLPAFVMTPVCVKCGEVHLERRCGKLPERSRSAPKKWRDMTVEEVRWAFENRVEIMAVKNTDLKGVDDVNNTNSENIT